MSTHKNIFWRTALNDYDTKTGRPNLPLKPWMGEGENEGKQFANVHLLIGYCPLSLPYMKKMVKEMKKTFPFIKEKDVEFSKVTDSRSCKGFTIATWNGFLDKKEYKGWWSVEMGRNPEYYWA